MCFAFFPSTQLHILSLARYCFKKVFDKRYFFLRKCYARMAMHAWLANYVLKGSELKGAIMKSIMLTSLPCEAALSLALVLGGSREEACTA